MISIFSRAPVLSAVVGITLIAGGAWAAMSLCGGACGTSSSDVVAAAPADGQVILTSSAAAAAPADAADKDCDKPCPHAGAKATTTAAAPADAAPADGAGSDCPHAASVTTVSTAPAAPADGAGADCPKPCKKALEAKGTVAAAPTGDGSTAAE